MRRNIFIAMIAGLCLGLVPAAVFAGGSGYMGSRDAMSSDSVGMVEADSWPVSDPVETGSVPGSIDRGKISVDDQTLSLQEFHERAIQLETNGE